MILAREKEVIIGGARRFQIKKFIDEGHCFMFRMMIMNSMPSS
jgi:hypothetical protein